MSASKPKGTRRRKFDQRSRSGCATCKKRRVKCDEVHPLCSNCTRLSLTCEYNQQLLWHEDALERGISFGRSKKYQVIKDQRSKKESSQKLELTLSELSQQNEVWVQVNDEIIFINTLVKDFNPERKQTHISEKFKGMMEIYSQLDTAKEPRFFEVYDDFDTQGLEINSDFLVDNAMELPSQSLSPLFNSLPSIPLAFDFDKENFSKELQAYDYMINKIFPNCICYGGDFKTVENPYLNYLVPISTNSSILFKTLIYYSTQVFSSINNEFKEISIKYRNEVLKDLPELIRFKQLIDIEDWEDVFGVIVILCSSNISSDCDMQWVIHSDGGKKMLNKMSKTTDPFKKFCIRYLTVHEVFRDTIVQNHDNFKYSDHDLFKNDHDDNIDVMLGCSISLVKTVDDITKLGEYYESLEFETSRNRVMLEKLILDKRDVLVKDLKKLKQNFKGKIDKNTYGIITVADIKQLSTRLYLLARIDLFYCKLNKTNVNKIYNQINGLIVEIVDKLKSLDYCTMSITWPLFLIGVVGNNLDEEIKWFIMKKFSEMENLRGLANIKLARSNVESVWKYRELNEDKLLTWKELMDFNSDTLSLA